MEQSKTELERWREWYSKQQIEDPHHVNFGTMIYIELLEKALCDLRSHPGSEVPTMQVGNSISEATPATVNENMLFTAKELAEPLTTSGAATIKIDREPEPFLNASSVESGKEFSGLNVEESRGGHDGELPAIVKQFLSDCLIPSIVEIEAAMRKEIDADRRRALTAMTSEGDRRLMDALFFQREFVSTELAFRILKHLENFSTPQKGFQGPPPIVSSSA